MYVDLLPNNSTQKFPALSEAVRIKQSVIGLTKNQEDPWFIHPEIYWKKLKNMRKYFKKYMESHWIEVEIQSKKQFQLLLQ